MNNARLPRVETVLLAGYHQWGVRVDGLLDCDVGFDNREAVAIDRARAAYPGADVIASDDPRHYSNV